MAGHIFLTGEKQVGKSTAIRRFLAHWPGGVDGFCTVSEFRDGDRVLYMTAADGSRRAPVAVLAPGTPRRLEHPEAFEELGADSLDIVELSMQLEEVFGLESMDDDDLSGIVSVGDLVNYLKSKLED